MHKRYGFSERPAELLGMSMMIGWALILGPVGALFLGGLAYAMASKSFTLGIFCGASFFSALFLTLAWGTIMWTSVGLKVRRKKDSPDNDDEARARAATPVFGVTSAEKSLMASR